MSGCYTRPFLKKVCRSGTNIEGLGEMFFYMKSPEFLLLTKRSFFQKKIFSDSKNLKKRNKVVRPFLSEFLSVPYCNISYRTVPQQTVYRSKKYHLA
jgi:hypothetical protein